MRELFLMGATQPDRGCNSILPILQNVAVDYEYTWIVSFDVCHLYKDFIITWITDSAG